MRDDTRGARSAARLRLAQGACLALSVLWLAVIGSCYAVRSPDGVAVTTFPVWLWALPGCAAAVVGLRRHAPRPGLLILAAWALVVAATAEEARAPFSWGRHWPSDAWETARGEGRALRVVTCNTGGGIIETVEEALAYEPDVLLLQESVAPTSLRRLASERGYQCVAGLDVAILARGELRPVALDGDRLVVAAAEAEVQGRSLGIVCAHPHLPSLDPRIWRPATWRAARQAYAHRAAQMDEVCAAIGRLDPSEPVIVGGDWNTPPGDPLFRRFRGRFEDCFAHAGIGFGNTIANDCPFSRIDQVYVSRGLRPAACVARKTANSDHRLVVADVIADR